MQAYKLNATIDESGHLIIDEPLNIAPGKVEVIQDLRQIMIKRTAFAQRLVEKDAKDTKE